MNVDYDGITAEITHLLDEALPEVEVTAEPAVVGAISPLEIGVYLVTDQTEESSLGMDDPYSVTLLYSLLCAAFSPDGVGAAATARGGLVNRAKEALKANRLINGKALTSQIGRIDFESAETDAGFFAAARIDFKVFIQ